MMKVRGRRQRWSVIAVVAAIAVLVTVTGCSSNGAGGDSEPETSNGAGGNSEPETYQIGDTGLGGGWVFYDKGEYTDDWRYLEAWTADEDGTYQWQTANESSSWTSIAIGSGYENTYTAMSGTEHPAAEVVINATHGGYDDWFLPSRAELDLMYENLHQEGIGGFALDWYWSSSAGGGSPVTNAWGQNLNDGIRDDRFKSIYNKVRAVRAF